MKPRLTRSFEFAGFGRTDGGTAISFPLRTRLRLAACVALRRMNSRLVEFDIFITAEKVRDESNNRA